jgi:uncharacterized protein YbjQ (UPF0145 family)
LTLAAVALLAISTQAGARTGSAAHQRRADMTKLDGEAAIAMRDAVKADTRAKPAPAPALPAMTAEQIVQRNAQARGGAQQWAAVQSISFAGKLDAGRERRDGGSIGAMTQNTKQAKLDARAEAIAAAKAQQADANARIIQLPYRAEFQRPTLMRAEVDFQGQTAVQVWDGSAGWKLRPFLGRSEVEPYTAEELRIAQSQQELDGPLINYGAKGNQVASDGTEKVENVDCYRLKVTLKNGDVRRMWLSAKTFLEVKAEDQPRHFNGKDRMVYTVFGDWRPVQGLMVAHRLETRVDGVPQSSRIVFEQVALNTPLDGGRFARPVRAD